MSKIKSAYFCNECGYESPKWLGKCPACHAWNSFAEEPTAKSNKNIWVGRKSRLAAAPIPIDEVSNDTLQRLITPDGELNRVLGGGIVPGSLVLIGGEPGIGKSTLMLQVALGLQGKTILYVSGEESLQQIKMRAERLTSHNSDCHLLPETDVRNVLQEADSMQPALMIVDSVQTLFLSNLESAPGTVSQVRESTAELLRFAKQSQVPIFLVGHITKDGSIAGPKVLEHMVDTVLQFEGERNMNYRILRAIKNRFGSASELGIYEMRSQGLREVTNPSEILLSHHDEPQSGVAIGAHLEGNRPLLMEVQALVSTANYGVPQRSSTGFDQRRLQMLLAVLEKRGGFRLGNQDVFLNIAGGFRVEDPAMDLSVCMAMISSLEERVISTKICMAAEVGLGGEIRAVNRVEQRIAEAAKLGFEKIIVSKYYSGDILKKDPSLPIEVIPVSTLNQSIMAVFGKV
jgi:DNA repair protein RadA/Sms